MLAGLRDHRPIQTKSCLQWNQSGARAGHQLCLLKPGDAALVDDPGYYNMFGNLRLRRGSKCWPLRMDPPDGPDINILETLGLGPQASENLLSQQDPMMQNPTGTDMSPHVAFRVLQAAERHNFAIVEDDIFSGNFQTRQTPRLATLDQLNRVIYDAQLRRRCQAACA